MDGENSEIERLGFQPQKELVFNKSLPYSSELDEESLKFSFRNQNQLIQSYPVAGTETRMCHLGLATNSLHHVVWVKIFQGRSHQLRESCI